MDIFDGIHSIVSKKLRNKRKKMEKIVIESLPQTSRRYPTFRFESCRPSGKMALEVKDISKAYGDNKVLENVSLTVRKGEVLGIGGVAGNGQDELLGVLSGEIQTAADAIYGALAEGDIGTHFPPSDPMWKGAESRLFLEHALSRVAARGFEITHIDCTIICEKPKIGPHAEAMRAQLANLTGLGTDRLSVKATTSERLGFTGREEGIASLATVTLVSR